MRTIEVRGEVVLTADRTKGSEPISSSLSRASFAGTFTIRKDSSPELSEREFVLQKIIN